MKRRCALLFAALGVMVVIAVLAAPKENRLLVLDWAAKAKAETPPTAILIQLGLKDTRPTPWDGRAVVKGAKVVHREGYCFRDKDKLVDPDGWEASSRRPIRVPARQPAIAKIEGIWPTGIVLHLTDVQADAAVTISIQTDDVGEKVVVPLKDVLAGQAKTFLDGAIAVRRITATTALNNARTEDDFPAAAYGPDGTLWVAYIAYHLVEEGRRIEAAQLKEQPVNFRAYDTPTFGDQLFVKYRRDGKWSAPIAITGAREDLVRCAIAVEGDGTPWVVYSAHRNGRHDLFTRPLGKDAKPGPEQQLTTEGGPHIGPVLCTDAAGNIRCSYQSWMDDGSARLALVSCQKGKWAPGLSGGGLEIPRYFFGGAGNTWHPAITAGPEGEVTTAYDSYENGDYDTKVHRQRAGEAANLRIQGSAKFEARPSACYDAKGRLWIAYEEGPELWGKDYGALEKKPGNPLYSGRTVRVVCLQDGKLFAPTPPLGDLVNKPPKFPYDMYDNVKVAAGPAYEKLTRYSNPALGLDGRGRLWLTYRQKFGTRYSTQLGSYWITFARRLDGDKWTEPIEVHHSDASLDSRPVLLPHVNGGVVIVHNGDGRFLAPEKPQNHVFVSHIDLPGDPVEPKLTPHEPGKKDDKAGDAEKEGVKRIRAYRMEAGDKKYQLLRGEFHRHTEVSWDGGPDGSLEDMFRYAIDTAALDWISNADHDNGAGREYSWWLTQKLTDAYHVKERFTPLFGYERSVSYPHGHRNCLFTRRGIRTLPRLAEPDEKKRVAGIHADDTKMFYRYLHELGGICASHTSATSMGTDWRDNDPVVEPIVEIYQGDRMSYEMQGAPRAGYDPKEKKEPANIAGWFPKGFIDLALSQKGFRFGFQSSSDHWSTHISFCVALAERHDREAIFDALKKRHCYGATDNIILDVKSGRFVMGDELKTAEAPKLQINVVGTGPLAKVEILKDSEVVHTIEPKKAEYQGVWADPQPTPGVHYYYVRVQQTGGELAWASPLWIEYTK